MKDITNKLLNMKKEIETAKQNKAKAEGQLEAFNKRLNDEFDCSTVEQAESKIKKLQEEMPILEKQIEAGMDELESSYEW